MAESGHEGASRGNDGRRPWIALGVGAAVAAGGAFAGWHGAEPEYTAAALIACEPPPRRILYQHSEADLGPALDAFVESHAAVAGSRRVSDLAHASAGWPKGSAPGSAATFHDSLLVARRRGTSILEIGFAASDADTAATGANAVVAAFLDVTEEQESGGHLVRLRQLEDRRRVHEARLAELDRESHQVTEELGPEALDARYRAVVSKLERVDAEVAQVDLEIARTGDVGREHPMTIRHERLVALRSETLDEMRAISRKSAQVGALREERRRIEEARQEVRRRIDELNLESSGRARLRVLSPASAPASPSSDPRPVLAGALGLAGFALGAGGVRLASSRAGSQKPSP